MGNLSNLYVSRSFQSLIHLATDNTASANLIGLEDGYGNPIGVSVNTTGDLSISGSFTASLQNGYVWVGDSSGKTTTVSTSSFGGGSVPAGTISGSAQITALGFVSSSITASSLVTASINNSTNTITFTKGDASTFDIVVQTGSVSPINTGSFATTGSNQFNGNQTVNGFVSASNGFYSGPNTTALNIGDGSNIRFWSGSTGGTEYFNVQLVPSVGDVAFSRSGASNVKVMTLAGVAGNNTTFQNNPVVFNDSVSSLTVNAQSTAISGSGSYTLSAASITEAAVNATTTATSSVRGTFGITGQSGDGQSIMLGHSGSLVLGNSTTNTYYAALAHLTSSVSNANTNLIFKTNTNTADTIISGSGNIFSNPAAPTAGFKRYIGTSNIFTHPNSVPQISGSMGFSPIMNANIINNNSNAFTLRGPVSSSAYLINHNVIAGGAVNLGTSAGSNFERANSGTNLFSNVINGTVNVIASKTPLSASVGLTSNIIAGASFINLDSSSVTLTTNAINGGLTVNNSYFPSTVNSTTATVLISGNTIGGSLTIYTSGSNASATGPQRSITGNLNAGNLNTISASFNGDSSSVNSVGLIGHSLVVYGNSVRSTGAPSNDYGSAFVGRWNDVNGAKANTADTIFAVGTGNAAARKTGLLIDSGSNMFVEGTLNVSGATSLNGNLNITGSLTASLQQGYVWVGNASGLTTTVATSSFGGGGGSTFPYTGIAEITGSLIVSGSTSNVLSASVGGVDILAVNGIVDIKQTGGSFSPSIRLNTSTTINSGADFIVNVGTDCKFNSDDIQLIGANPFFRFDNSNGGTPLAIRSYQNLLTVENLIDASRIATFDVAGTTLSGSVGHSITGSTSILGNTTLSGSLFIQSGSTFPNQTGSALLSYDFATGKVAHTTYQSALPALFDVGAFYSTITQSGSANVSGSFVFDNTVPINSINITSGSRINIPAGDSAYYNFQFSVQAVQGSGAADVAVWLKKNGANVQNTATYVTIPSNHKSLIALNLWDSGSAGDYFELAYQSNSADTTYQYIAPTGNIPGSPSIILTVNQVR